MIHQQYSLLNRNFIIRLTSLKIFDLRKHKSKRFFKSAEFNYLLYEENIHKHLRVEKNKYF